MFDKLITVNYRRGLGGEFFCYLLDEALHKNDFVQDLSFGTENRYEYVGVDFIFRTYLHHFFWCTFSNYEGIEEYVESEFYYPSKFNTPIRKMDGLIKTYNTLIRDHDREKQVENIVDYCASVCKSHYDEYLSSTENKFAVSNLHYDSCNRFGAPLQKFFPSSINLSMINSTHAECFYTLLWIYKRLPDLKYYPAAMKSFYKRSLDDLLDYFKFYEKKTYCTFENEIVFEAFDFHFRGLKIDEQLSEELGTKVSLDYDRVRVYGEKNRQIIIDTFGIDAFKEYPVTVYEDKLKDYIRKVYDSI